MSYNLRQTSNLLGIKVRTVREWIRNGKLSAQKDPFNKRWFVTEEEISRIKERQVGH